MLNIQDFIDAGTCPDGVLKIVESTGKIQLPVAVLLKINSAWTEQCLSGYGTYGARYGYNIRSGDDPGYGQDKDYGSSNRCGDGHGYGHGYGTNIDGKGQGFGSVYGRRSYIASYGYGGHGYGQGYGSSDADAYGYDGRGGYSNNEGENK